MKGWVGLLGGLLADGLPTKVVTISCRSNAGQGKFARPAFHAVCHAPFPRKKIIFRNWNGVHWQTSSITTTSSNVKMAVTLTKLQLLLTTWFDSKTPCGAPERRGVPAKSPADPYLKPALRAKGCSSLWILTCFGSFLSYLRVDQKTPNLTAF